MLSLAIITTNMISITLIAKGYEAAFQVAAFFGVAFTAAYALVGG